MKEHAIIPVFISHRGCPNGCVFCNQKKITARQGDVSPEDVRNTIEQWLTTLRPDGMTAQTMTYDDKRNYPRTVEMAFFGGSFTGLPIEEQQYYLSVAKEYKDAGRIDGIHLSTRPDYISREILDNLKAYSVDVIELGAQSFDDEVLKASGRGHDAQAIYDACELIKEYGFTLGIQLMIGLPGDSMESCIRSAEETVKIKPAVARLYPTVTLQDTELYEMYLRGEYAPLGEEEAVERTKVMYEMIADAGINIIRVGLKSSEIMEKEISFHPAFRQLVEGRIARDRIEEQILDLLPEIEWAGSVGSEYHNPIDLQVIANEKSFGNIFGHKGCNREYFRRKYPLVILNCYQDYNMGMYLDDNEYIVRD